MGELFKIVKSPQVLLIGALALVATLILSAIVASVGQGEVRLNGPANGTWFNSTNLTLTQGFNITWSSPNDVVTNYANCTLYVGQNSSNITNFGTLISPGHKQQSAIIANNSNSTILYMNHPYTTNNSKVYWTTLCYNLTSTDGQPGGWAPDWNIFFVDTSVPNLSITATGNFTNNTWSTTGFAYWEVNITALVTVEELYNVSLSNASNGEHYFFTLTDVSNNTRTNISYRFADGNYTVKLKVRDRASNPFINTTPYFISVDRTAPANLTYLGNTSAETVNANLVNQSATFAFLNFTFNETYIRNISIVFNGTTYYWNLTAESSGYFNCTFTARVGATCYRNFSGLTEKTNINYFINITDEAGNQLVGANRSFSILTTLPNFPAAAMKNITSSLSVALANFTFNSIEARTCGFKIYNATNSLKSTVPGLLNSNVSCNATFQSFNITDFGVFTISGFVNDSLGNYNETNTTGVFQNLTAGWNMLTYTDNASGATPLSLCSSVFGCSQVSWFNNTNGSKAFTTYVNSTPTVNNNTDIKVGSAFFMYADFNTSIIMNNFVPLRGSSEENITLGAGWNAVGLFSNVNMNNTLNVSTINTTLIKTDVSYFNVTFVSQHDASINKYRTCSRAAYLCTGTITVPHNVIVKKGLSIWMLADYNVTINRTSIGGVT